MQPLLRTGLHAGADPQVLAVAMRKAVINRGVSVVVLPGDVALKAARSASSHWYHAPLPTVTPAKKKSCWRSLFATQQYRAHVRQRLRRPRNWWPAAKIKAPIVHALRQRARGVRQPVRCGHDRADWLLFWLHTMMNADTLILLAPSSPIAPSTQPTRKLSRSTSTPAASAHTVRSTWRWWAILNRR